MGHQNISRIRSYSKSNHKLDKNIKNYYIGFAILIIGFVLVTTNSNNNAIDLTEPIRQVGIGMVILGIIYIVFTPLIKTFWGIKMTNKKNNKPKWKRDYTWGTSNVLKDDIGYRLRYSILIEFVFILFLALFSITDYPKIIIVLLLIGTLFFLYKLMVIVNEYMEFGVTNLLMTDYPQLISNPMSILFKNNKMDSSYKILYTHLKYIQEIVTYTETSDGTEKKVSYIEKHKDLQMFSIENGVAHIKLELPKNGKPNHLSIKNASYWVLDIEASDTKGKVFKTTFLLPIYNEEMLGLVNN